MTLWHTYWTYWTAGHWYRNSHFQQLGKDKSLSNNNNDSVKKYSKLGLLKEYFVSCYTCYLFIHPVLFTSLSQQQYLWVWTSANFRSCTHLTHVQNSGSSWILNHLCFIPFIHQEKSLFWRVIGLLVCCLWNTLSWSVARGTAIMSHVLVIIFSWSSFSHSLASCV